MIALENNRIHVTRWLNKRVRPSCAPTVYACKAIILERLPFLKYHLKGVKLNLRDCEELLCETMIRDIKLSRFLVKKYGDILHPLEETFRKLKLPSKKQFYQWDTLITQIDDGKIPDMKETLKDFAFINESLYDLAPSAEVGKILLAHNNKWHAFVEKRIASLVDSL